MRNKIKSENGAITLITIVSVLFMISFLMSTYIVISNKAQKSAQATEEIARKYNNLGNLETIYANYFSSENVIPIETREQLVLIGSDEEVQIDGKYYTYAADGYYILKNDIDLGGYDSTNNVWIDAKQWTPLGNTFTGTLDGLGNSIKGLFINSNSNNQGLFGQLRGTVKNLNIKDSLIKGNNYVGAIAGAVDSNNGGAIKNCYNSAPVMGVDYVGGIAGGMQNTVVNCKNTGSVLGDTHVTGGYFREKGGNSTIDIWRIDTVLDRNCEFVSGDKVAIAPKGFKVSADVYEQTIDQGVVIQDAAGNEFVWVPVTVSGNTMAEKEAAFDNLRTLAGNSTYPEPSSNAAQWELDEYAEMRASVIINGGFYIGRYEAGIPVTENARLYNMFGTEHITNTMVVKRDCYPYSIAPWGLTMQDYESLVVNGDNKYGHGAVYLSKNMYTGDNYGVTSTLTYGVQFDCTLNFVSDAQHDINSSTSWGNYKDNAYTIDRKGARYSNNGSAWTIINNSITKQNGDRYLLTTGASDSFKAKNIYDLAGNEHEWTMEATVNTSSLRHLRGGAYTRDGTASPASNNEHDGVIQASLSYGFRPALYIKLEPANPQLVVPGTFVQYDVEYADMYDTSKTYSSTNGWRIQSVTNNGDGTYSNLKLISSGVPAKLHYFYYDGGTDNDLSWWEYDRTGDFRTELNKNGTYNFYTTSNYRSICASAGLFYNFGNVKFASAQSSRGYGKGYFNTISREGTVYNNSNTSNSNEVTGNNLFKVNSRQVTVRIMTLPELNLGVGGGRAVDSLDTVTDTTGLYILSDHSNLGEFIIASPDPRANNVNSICCMDFLRGNLNCANELNIGVRPMICFNSNVRLTLSRDGTYLIIY